jgi:hypothetical protein
MEEIWMTGNWSGLEAFSPPTAGVWCDRSLYQDVSSHCSS